MAKPKTRKVYRLDWYDIEASAEWGEGATVPPLVHSVGFILSWPRKNQKVPCYRIAGDYCEEGPGSPKIIPTAVVLGEPLLIYTMPITYRTRKERGDE